MRHSNLRETIRIFIFYCILLCFLNSCHQKNSDKTFIDKFGNDKFENFFNTLLYFRSLDNSGNFIYFFNSLSDTCESPYIVTINKDSKKATKVDLKLRKRFCREVNWDTTFIKSLVEEFLKYEVSLLKVDVDSIVYVNIGRPEEANLIRLPKSIPSERFKNLKNFQNNWYYKEE